MEYTEGPIIMDECCLNCVHSVERKNGIACVDSGFFLRMFKGGRRIEYPNIEKCNRFEHIPSVNDKMCKYCVHFGYHLDAPACYNISLRELLAFGARMVEPTATCADFKLAKMYQQRKWHGR